MMILIILDYNKHVWFPRNAHCTQSTWAEENQDDDSARRFKFCVCAQLVKIKSAALELLALMVGSAC